MNLSELCMTSKWQPVEGVVCLMLSGGGLDE